MMNKGYDFPLYSLELVHDPSALSDEPRYTIEVPQGLLVVRPALRRRAACTTTSVCDTAVETALSHHYTHIEGFSSFGLDADWAQHMRHWQQRLLAEDEAAAPILVDARLGSQQLAGLVQQGQKMWSRLSLCAKLAGKAGLVVSGRAPEDRVKLIDALALAQQRAQDQAPALAQHGFGPTEMALLQNIITALREGHDQSARLGFQRQRHSDTAVVIRGALLGDLSRLAKIGPQVLLPAQAAALLVQRLVPRRRHQPGTQPQTIPNPTAAPG